MIVRPFSQEEQEILHRDREVLLCGGLEGLPVVLYKVQRFTEHHPFLANQKDLKMRISSLNIFIDINEHKIIINTHYNSRLGTMSKPNPLSPASSVCSLSVSFRGNYFLGPIFKRPSIFQQSQKVMPKSKHSFTLLRHGYFLILRGEIQRSTTRYLSFQGNAHEDFFEKV